MTLTVQFYTMIAMVAMGVWLGVAMDTYSRFFHPSKSKSLWLYANDVVFWLLQGLLIFYVLYVVNEGELRLYVFLALLCGYAAYRALLQPLYRRSRTNYYNNQGAHSFCTDFFHSYCVYQMRFISKSIKLMYGCSEYRTTIFWFIIKLFWVPLKWIFFLIWKLYPIVSKCSNKSSRICR